MKHFLFITALCAVSLLPSCIDKEFDLSDLDTDDIAIGSNDSEFFMPLLTVKFQSENICQNKGEDESSIMQLYDRINVWIPAQLPDNASYIDMVRLPNDEPYRHAILHALYDEMTTNELKRKSVCEMVCDQYRYELCDLLLNSPNPYLKSAAPTIETMPNTQAAAILEELFLTFPNDVELVLDDLSMEDLIKYDMEDVNIDIPALDISDEVKDMITENLDPASVTEPENALYLYGTVESDFPFMFHISPQITDTNIYFGDIYVDNQTTNINQVRIYREDVEQLFVGSQLIMPIKLDRYYPNRPFTDQSQIEITINMRKTGGLNL